MAKQYIGGAVMGLLCVGLVGVSVYFYLALGSQRNDVDTLEQRVVKLEDAAKTAKEVPKLETTNPTGKDEEQNKPITDQNFVALKPDSGYMTSQTEVKFEWTAHQAATKYAVEIKRPGQATYPSSTPASQIVEAKGQGEQSLTMTLGDGDYVWRVTALKGDTVLQHTEDRNYQVMTSM